ncbi:hypothetical protein INT45_010670 [Circinella minor]|uniref:Uncharacterized protein n=1 Tax=Circinella minor TaxID=1195481 RepID=A0A8H7S3J6_9FUNG|nr:hypothetical protein INT45_010670 [Circinella minor]
MIRSTRSLTSQATTALTSIANPTSNVRRIRLVVNPPTSILTSSPISTSAPEHVFAIPAPVRRVEDHWAAIGNAHAFAPITTLPDPTPARWVNAGRVAMGNAVPIAHDSVFALPAVVSRAGAVSTGPGVPATTSRVSAVATDTVTTSAASPVTTSTAVPITTSAAVPATIPAATPTTTSEPTPPATIPAATPAITSAPTPPARPILTPRPVRALRDARAARAAAAVGAHAGATGENGENEEERDEDDDADVKMEIDWKFGDMEYMEVDWCEGDMDVDIVPPNATSLWF